MKLSFGHAGMFKSHLGFTFHHIHAIICFLTQLICVSIIDLHTHYGTSVIFQVTETCQNWTLLQWWQAQTYSAVNWVWIIIVIKNCQCVFQWLKILMTVRLVNLGALIFQACLRAAVLVTMLNNSWWHCKIFLMTLTIKVFKISIVCNPFWLFDYQLMNYISFKNHRQPGFGLKSVSQGPSTLPMNWLFAMMVKSV